MSTYPTRAIEIGSASPDFDALASTASELFSRHYPRLVRMVTRRNGDAEVAQDIAQETILKALVCSQRWDWERPAWPLLKTVATNLLIDHARKSQREVMRADMGESPFAQNVPDSLVGETLVNLPKRQRVALALRYLEGWSTADAASYLGLGIPAFEQLLFRARSRFRVEYERVLAAAKASVLLPIQSLRGLIGRIRTAKHSENAAALAQLSNAASLQFVCAVVVAVSGVTAGVVPGPVHGTQSRGPKFAAGAPEHARPERGNHKSQGIVAGSTMDDSGASTGGATPAGPKEATVPGIANDLTRPDRDVERPEQTHITSIAASPNFDEDGTMFASGIVPCHRLACPSVLFVSRDEGRTWRREPAKSFNGSMLALPPGFGVTDHRIFSMGPTGLQISNDGGRSFDTPGLGSSSKLVGSIAISPNFDSGDPSVLVGAQTLLRYNAIDKIFSPAGYSALPGPLEPAYLPGTNSDLIVGAIATAPRGLVSAVFKCVTNVCNQLELPGRPGQEVPKIRVSPSFTKDDTVYAFTEGSLWMSDSAGGVFGSLPTPEDLISDLAIGKRGLYAAAQYSRPDSPLDAGVYFFDGRHWAPINDPLLDAGVSSVSVKGNVIVAALAEKGIACSSDSGATWSTRC